MKMRKVTKKAAAIMVTSLLAIPLTVGLSAAADKLIVQDASLNNVFTVDDAGVMLAKKGGFGTPNPQSSFHLTDEAFNFDRGLTIGMHGDGAAAAIVNIKKSWGTEAAPTAVSSTDNIVAFHGQAYDGNSWVVPASFMFVVDGPVSDQNVPAAMIFKTGAVNPTPERMRISSAGTVTISDLAGSGNAYVCVDSAGVIFQSGSPCL
jgi:hypothetical protein